MDVFKILLALLDFVPCILCFLAMFKLTKILYHHMSKYAFAMLASGTFMVLVAGTLKAIWKIFYYASNGSIDLYKLNHQMMPIQALGFIFAYVGLIIMIIDFNKSNKNDVKLKSITPFLFLPLLSGLIPYVGKDTKDPALIVYIVLLIIGSLGFYLTIAFIAFKKKKQLYGVFIILTAISALAMGYLATKIEGDNLWLNFAAEMTNVAGQTLFLIAVYGIAKIDLSDIKTLLTKKKK